MKTVAHLSDLHFGAEDPKVVDGIVRELKHRKPSLVAISGDLTQRARRKQFQTAREFLDRIPFPVLTVPGNHDIPLYDVIRRFLKPLDRYREFITKDLTPIVEMDNLLVMGLNTARSATFSGGRISHHQMARLRHELRDLHPDTFKIVVTHHPFVPPAHRPGASIVGRAGLTLEVLESCAVDMLLAGHFHLSFHRDLREHHVQVKRSILVAQAGTATSVRTRGEPNSYNFIAIDPPHVTVEVMFWNGSHFQVAEKSRFRKIDHVWQKE